jgi:hypothetical protein
MLTEGIALEDDAIVDRISPQRYKSRGSFTRDISSCLIYFHYLC